MNRPFYMVQEHKIQMDWLKGTKPDLYMQYLVNGFYLCRLIEEENEEEIDRLAQKMIQKMKKEDKSLYILSLDDQQKEYQMEKKSKTFGKTLKRRLIIQDMKIVQQKESKGKIITKEFPIPTTLTIEIKDDKSKAWMKDAISQNARMLVNFSQRKPIIAYFEDKQEATKIKDAFIAQTITKQRNLLEALKISHQRLIQQVVIKFKEQIDLFAKSLYKQNNLISDGQMNASEDKNSSVPEEYDPDQNENKLGNGKPAKQLKDIDEEEKKEQKEEITDSSKFGMGQFKEDIEENDLEEELNNFDVSKSFLRDEKDKSKGQNKAMTDSQEKEEENVRQFIMSNVNLDEDDKKQSQLKIDTKLTIQNQEKYNQLTVDIDTRPTTKAERPKDINADTITQQVNEKYTKFCKNLILEHTIEELNHVSQENHPMKMVGILKQTIQKLKEGIKVIMFLCNERKNMVTLIENQQELVEKQINEMNQMNLREKLSQLDENFFKNQLLLLNNYLKQFYNFVQNCQKSIEILEQIFKYDPEWRQDPRYKNQNILNDMEELPKHCFKIHTYHSEKLKEVKKLYDTIVKQDANQVKYIEYTQTEIKQTVDLLMPLSEHFEHNSTIEFEILFFLFIEDIKALNDKFQSSYTKQQENINSFKKSYEDIRNFYYQRLQKMLELKYQNNVSKQKLMRISIPCNTKANNQILTEGLESIQQVDKQLELLKYDLSSPQSEGTYFQQIKLYEDLKAQEIIKDFEGEIIALKQIFQTAAQIEVMEKTVEKLTKLRDSFDYEEVEQDIMESQVEQYKQLIVIVEKYSEDMNQLVEISPTFRSFHSKICSEIQLSQVVLEVIDFQ